MYFNSSSYVNSYSSQKWDPEAVLKFTNPVTQSPTCIGYARTQGRRCQRYIAQGKTAYARGILKKLSTVDASKAAVSPDLAEVVDTMLCWQHGCQSSSLLSQWRRKLENWAAANENNASSTSCSDSEDDTWSYKSEPRDHIKKEATEDDLSAEELRKILKRMQESLARLEAELRRRGGEHIKQEDLAEEGISQKTKRGETRRQSQEREEQRQEQQKRRQEEERRRKEEEEREEERKREEEKRRAEKAREEAFRERVRFAKKKREQEARERIEKEEAEWRAAWKRYSDAWDGSIHLSLPWPVKSGLQSDVTEVNVKLFFMKAPPEEMINSGEKHFNLINKEIKRWHTDKVMQRFGSGVVNGATKDALGTIAKVMVDLRQEARKNR
ncbi:hypothetical protein F4819DRAFT_5353 [Hypoxylon fuscum]|nr:hypothetical protein F4819DRAFT_5353 [Hypoxylon fuscum]